MLGVYVETPIACFRRGMAREYLETERLAPPSTCYGFLLSLVGETDRSRHVGARICPVLLNQPALSVVLRTLWRVKKVPLGSSGNARPDFQQLLSPVEMLIWLESSEESGSPRLEDRVREALTRPSAVSRFGGLSLGESTHLVNQVSLTSGCPDQRGLAFHADANGDVTLPVWVDHVGSAGTRFISGCFEQVPLCEPAHEQMCIIGPPR